MTLVVVGASLAGFKTAEALRTFGCEDEITVVGAEGHAPYDRPPLSKAALSSDVDVADLTLGNLGPDVRMRLGVEAASLDLSGQAVILADGATIDFRTLVVCTGATPRRLPVAHPAGVHYLRTYDDAAALRRDLRRAKKLAVIGAGFVGAEVAASARQLGLEVVVLESAAAPLERVLGADVGRRLSETHLERGVEFRCNETVVGFEGASHVNGVNLASGETIDADVVVVGIGAVPETSWLQDSGLKLDDGLVCDATLRAEGSANVYAAGDVCRWFDVTRGDLVRVEHWSNAVAQAAHVAQTIVGEPEPYEHVPYVWSHQYEHQIQMVGRVGPTDDSETSDEAGGGFVTLFHRSGRLTGAVLVDRPRLVPRLTRLLSRGEGIECAVEVVGRSHRQTTAIEETS